MVVDIDKALMNKKVRIVSGTIKDFELFPSFGILGGKAFTQAVLHVKECGHVTFTVVGKIPEGDESEGAPMRNSEGDLILTRHDACHCPHKVLEVEPHLVKGEGGICLTLGGGGKWRGERRRANMKFVSMCIYSQISNAMATIYTVITKINAMYMYVSHMYIKVQLTLMRRCK